LRRIAVAVALTIAASSCGGSEPTVDGTFAASIDPGSPSAMADALRGFRGKPAVVNFWATWCDPCKKEMPRLVTAYEKYKGRVAFLGIDVQDDPDAAPAFARRYRIPFRSLADRAGDIRRKEKILGLPVTQFYDDDGDLAFVHNGEIRSDELEEKIEELLRSGD
jgi:cytochrome c biogenesis protein CcmG, thiol:disulfide interchange protein DsbE